MLVGDTDIPCCVFGQVLPVLLTHFVAAIRHALCIDKISHHIGLENGMVLSFSSYILLGGQSYAVRVAGL